MNQPPWYERLFDRDNSVAPFVVLGLLVLVFVLVLVVSPMLQRGIEGDQPTPTPSSKLRDGGPPLVAWDYRQNG